MSVIRDRLIVREQRVGGSSLGKPGENLAHRLGRGGLIGLCVYVTASTGSRTQLRKLEMEYIFPDMNQGALRFCIGMMIVVTAVSCGGRRQRASTHPAVQRGIPNTWTVSMPAEEVRARVLQFLTSRAIAPDDTGRTDGVITASGKASDAEFIDCQTRTSRAIWLDEITFELQIMIFGRGAKSEVTVGVRGQAKKYTRRRTMLVAHRTRFEQISCASSGRLEAELSQYLNARASEP